MKYFVLHLNPEPWALGKVNRGGKGRGGISPNQGLVAYQNAVKEDLNAQEVGPLPWPEVSLSFYFWRRLDQYITMNDRQAQRHQADATNLGKGLEDALQHILFDNDRVVRDVHSVIMEQSTKTKPLIVVEARPFSEERNLSRVLDSFPYSVTQQMERTPEHAQGNSWGNNEENLF